ncbi:DUF6912 family protein [Prauserella muralis]|uniref:Uncharacterized protein n=1 Tax=Prauserella muralis TaxID=588067 RepID=A0A2V4ALB6_9PSEU|nr:hypothetical protein [Prauserella muralis]PXY21067.1 hypothetical protein BAY60_26720 [Prauserella muralis]TWE30146.1 hypothetical protein FHX69_2843 [Prauserella muralis]
MRVYLPATIGMLRQLVSDGELMPLSGTGFALTPALRESYVSGSTEELEYAALLDAARASLRLLASSQEPGASDTKEPPRRVVISADVEHATLRPDLDHAVVRLSGPVRLDEVAAVHVDAAEAEPAVLAAAAVIDAADLGDPDAEFTLGDVEDHELAWYAPQELPFLLELM